MHKKTKSLLEELQTFGDTRDMNHIIESEKKLLSAIKSKDQARFTKSLRKKNEN